MNDYLTIMQLKIRSIQLKPPLSDLAAYPPPALALADALAPPAIALELALPVNGNLSSNGLSLK
jgi:hypothetical protein